MSNVLSVFSRDVGDLFNNRPVHTKSTHYVESFTGDHLSWSSTRLYTDCIPCGTTELLLFASVCGLRSLRNDGAHAPCGRVQLSVIGAAKVSHFKIMCRVLGRVPTVGTFRRLYVNSISNGWLSFSKRGGVDDPFCYSKKFDSLKNWNNLFFWINAPVCQLSTSWFSGVSVIKDPLPVDEAVDL
nr:hypothetical protein [Tanacetum cinerariifolium]